MIIAIIATDTNAIKPTKSNNSRNTRTYDTVKVYVVPEIVTVNVVTPVRSNSHAGGLFVSPPLKSCKTCLSGNTSIAVIPVYTPAVTCFAGPVFAVTVAVC